MNILISYPSELSNEIAVINQAAVHQKWDKFHLRKPGWTQGEIKELYEELDEEVKRKTVLHKQFRGSCHSFKEVEALDGQLEYCFLSPVFDSISKQGYKANFDKEELKEFLQKERNIKVIGLGGVTDENYNELIKMGFDGGAFLGSVWKQYE